MQDKTRSGDQTVSKTMLVLVRDSNSGRSVPFIPELQTSSCQSSKYRNEPFTHCVSCTRRLGGDTCRFQGIRYIIRDFEDNFFVGTSFVEKVQLNETCKMDFPSTWNRTFDREHIQRSKLSIAKALFPTLVMEQNHIESTREIIRRQRETNVRVTCDTCMTSLFCTSFMCRKCGREVCNECFQIVKTLTDNTTSSQRKLQGAYSRSFLYCFRTVPHTYAEFTPVTRFAQSELHLAIEEMRSILEKEEISSETIPLQTEGRTYSDVMNNPASLFPDPIVSPVFDDFTPPNTPAYVSDIPIHRAQVILASLYDPLPSASDFGQGPMPSFPSLWVRGLPILVKKILPRFKLPWDPEYFITTYGEQNCTIIECQTEETRDIRVRDFFACFGQYENRKECWKLKDWPSTEDFQSTFPELFDDFSNAVPVPDYVRRDGVLNMVSHFPSGALAPDVGPKMYNSMATSQEVGSQGSTRLHMDMADAFNVMLYASRCADGSPGYAVWDLFHAEDSDKIRSFLRKKFNSLMPNGQDDNISVQELAKYDPIHTQRYYLDVGLRRQLWEGYGVKSYRVYQRPGDGVFIPAGCAHQVANIADCMKIAIDFVSPENIDRCEKLTKEFREQNQRKAWKEDVLQLRSMMWFAWQSCSKKELKVEEIPRHEDAKSSLHGAEPEEELADLVPRELITPTETVSNSS